MGRRKDKYFKKISGARFMKKTVVRNKYVPIIYLPTYIPINIHITAKMSVC